MLGSTRRHSRIYEREDSSNQAERGKRALFREDVEKLEMILRLTRELGVKPCRRRGISRCARNGTMQREMRKTIHLLRDELEHDPAQEEMRSFSAGWEKN